MLEKIESKRRRGRQRMKRLDSITDSMHINMSILWEVAKDKKAWCQWGCSPWGHRVKCNKVTIPPPRSLPCRIQNCFFLKWPPLSDSVKHSPLFSLSLSLSLKFILHIYFFSIFSVQLFTPLFKTLNTVFWTLYKVKWSELYLYVTLCKVK